LGSYPEHRKLSHLFTTILQVKDAGQQDWLDELEYMKDCKARDLSKMTKIYSCLQREFEKDTSCEYLR
jgi:hypothetical protein